MNPRQSTMPPSPHHTDLEPSDRTANARALAHSVGVEAVLERFFPRGDKDHFHEAERVVDVVLSATAHIIEAGAGRMTVGGYGAHWSTCWRMHADCAVLHAIALDRAASIDDTLLAAAGDVAAVRQAAAAALRALLREVDEYGHRLPRELAGRVHRAATYSEPDPLVERLAALSTPAGR